MRVLRHVDARAFLERAEHWLLEAELENAVALTSARQAKHDDSRYQKPVYWATIEEDGQIVGYAYRTPPYRLGVSALPEPAIAQLLADVGSVYPTLSGVSGPEPTASQFATAWTLPRRLTTVTILRQRLYSLAASLTAPENPEGHLRLATPADAALARRWGAAFLAETGLAQVDVKLFGQLIQARQLYFWDDDEPRCMAGPIRQMANGAVIGILYTPGESRRRGYAKTTLAALAATLREGGLHHCYLYADPTNTGADVAARSIGFEPVLDSADIDFR